MSDLAVGHCIFCAAECWARDDAPVCYQCVRQGKADAL